MPAGFPFVRTVDILAALRSASTIGDACKAAKCSRETVARRAKKDPEVAQAVANCKAKKGRGRSARADRARRAKARKAPTNHAERDAKRADEIRQVLYVGAVGLAEIPKLQLEAIKTWLKWFDASRAAVKASPAAPPPRRPVEERRDFAVRFREVMAG